LQNIKQNSILMGRSSEEFIKQRQEEIDSLPNYKMPFSWQDNFVNLGTQYINNEEQNI